MAQPFRQLIALNPQRALRRRHDPAGRFRQQIKHPKQQRRGGIAPVIARTGRTVGPPDPDAHGVIGIKAQGPGIAETVGSAGFMGDVAGTSNAGGRGHGWRNRRMAQNIAEMPAGGFAQQALAWRQWISGAKAQWRNDPAIGQANIQRCQLLESHAHPAQHQRQPRLWVRLTPVQRQTDFAQTRRHSRWPHLFQNRHRRDIQRLLQRLAHGQLPDVGIAEVGWTVIAKPGWRIINQGFRVNQPVVKTEAVNQRFQRGTGRAHRSNHIHLSGSARIVKIAAADIGQHSPIRVGDHDNRQTAIQFQRRLLLAGQGFQSLLQAAINKSSLHHRFRVRRPQPFGEMRSEKRQGSQAGRQWFLPGFIGLPLAQNPQLRHA